MAEVECTGLENLLPLYRSISAILLRPVIDCFRQGISSVVVLSGFLMPRRHFYSGYKSGCNPRGGDRRSADNLRDFRLSARRRTTSRTASAKSGSFKRAESSFSAGPCSMRQARQRHQSRYDCTSSTAIVAAAPNARKETTSQSGPHSNSLSGARKQCSEKAKNESMKLFERSPSGSFPVQELAGRVHASADRSVCRCRLTTRRRARNSLKCAATAAQSLRRLQSGWRCR